MKLGLLGTGMIVKEVLTFIDELNLERVVILGTERSREKTLKLVEEYKLDGCYFDYDELLADDIDTVYVGLPNFLHYSFAKKALESGKHAIIEKPVTANAEEMRELMEIAEQRGLMIFEAVNIHYTPAFTAVKEEISKLGDIRIVNFNYSQYSSRYDAFKEGNILPAFDYHKAGGALMDINVYNVNAAMGLFGTPEDAQYYPNLACGIDTSGILVLDYKKFKVVCIGAKDCSAPGRSTIQGDRGVVVLNSPVNTLKEYEVMEYGSEAELKTFGQNRHRMFYEFVEFIRMVEEKDFEKQKKMLQLSYDIAKVMEKARKSAGIFFDNDKESTERD